MIKPIEINEIPNIYRGHIMDDIDKFMNSDAEACEVFGGEKQSAESLQAGYCSAAKRSGYAVKVMRRNNRVFLVKESVGRN